MDRDRKSIKSDFLTYNMFWSSQGMKTYLFSPSTTYQDKIWIGKQKYFHIDNEQYAKFCRSLSSDYGLSVWNADHVS